MSKILPSCLKDFSSTQQEQSPTSGVARSTSSSELKRYADTSILTLILRSPRRTRHKDTFRNYNNKLNTKLMDVKNIEEEIKEKSAQLLPAQHSEPVTPERSPPKKQVWRKKDQSTPSEDQ
jgi:hypothetical protein